MYVRLVTASVTVTASVKPYLRYNFINPPAKKSALECNHLCKKIFVTVTVGGKSELL